MTKRIIFLYKKGWENLFNRVFCIKR